MPLCHFMENNWTDVEGGLTAPEGFRAGAISCGIKDPSADRLDLALVFTPHPTVSAGVFTNNKVKAAPVRVSRDHLRRTHDVRAIIANSGNANACTGPQGMIHAKEMAKLTAKSLGIKMNQVAVCSTGIIGMNLPIERISPKIPELSRGCTAHGSGDAARAIMTSDTRPKSVSLEVPVGGKPVRIGGIAKGAGMIRPDMATMLSFITSDVAISHGLLKRCVDTAVGLTFNSITVDGDTSTNDTVIVITNALAGNKMIRSTGTDYEAFCKTLTEVMLRLAKMIVGDGERITRIVTIHVRGAANANDARKAAEAVANSTLVKCSWFGGDPNWGRVIHAVGYSGARMREEYVDIYFDGKLACKNGLAAQTPLAELTPIAARREFTVTIDLNMGSAGTTVYTTDLTPEYVNFNSSEYAAAKRKQPLV